MLTFAYCHLINYDLSMGRTPTIAYNLEFPNASLILRYGYRPEIQDLAELKPL